MLARYSYADADVLGAVMQLGWLRDDLTETEAEVLQYFSRLAHEDPDGALAALQMEWVRDGVTWTELDELQRQYPVSR